MSHVITKLINEKTTNLEKSQVYAFEVAKDASKTQIAQAIIELYGQRPLAVNVVTRPPQARRAGKSRAVTFTPTRKIAYMKMKSPIGKISNT